MRRHLLTSLFVLLIVPFVGAQAYTVVLKNGKVMKGTYVSETNDSLVFKDEKGFQYSLKKSLLDLEKMEEANKPPEPPPVAAELAPEPAPEPEPPPPAEKKPVRTFTTADIERLNNKNSKPPGSFTTQPQAVVPSPPPIPPLMEPAAASVALSPAEYVNSMHSAASTLKEAQDQLRTVAESMMASFEIAASTGADGRAALNEYLEGKEARAVLGAIDTNLSKLYTLNAQLAKPPAGYEKAYQTFDSGLREIQEMRAFLAAPKITASTAPFKSRLSKTTDQISRSIEILQQLQ